MSSSGGSTHRPPRCLYECLDVDRSANEADLKKAYRKAALKWHPDKNTGNDEATAIFQEIQHAYAVLSDGNERKWYDDHREDILRGGAGEGEESERKVNLYPFFSPSAYTGFGDDEKGFYAVYANAFTTILNTESAERAQEAPPFGTSKSLHASVAAFYNYWLHFHTSLDFAWEDEYNLTEAPNRNVRRLMEKENNKNRATAKKEYSSQIKCLVEYVRRRDKRVIEAKVQAAAEKERKEKEAKEQSVRRAAEMVRLKAEWSERRSAELLAEEAHAIPGVGAVLLADEDSDSDDAGGGKGRKRGKKSKGKGGKAHEVVVYRCSVCSKDFKSEKQMANHEGSKAHKKKLQELEATMLAEALAEGAVLSAVEEESEENDYSSSSSDSKEFEDDVYIDPVIQELEFGVITVEDLEEEEEEETPTENTSKPPVTAKRKKKKKGGKKSPIVEETKDEDEQESETDSSESDLDVEQLIGGGFRHQHHQHKEHASRKNDSSSESSSESSDSSSENDEEEEYSKKSTNNGVGKAVINNGKHNKSSNSVSGKLKTPKSESESASNSEESEESDVEDEEFCIVSSTGGTMPLPKPPKKGNKKNNNTSCKEEVGGKTGENDLEKDAENDKKGVPIVKDRAKNRAKLRKAAKAAAAAGGGKGAPGGSKDTAEDSETVCKVCGNEFTSKTQLFKHIKATGHAALKKR